MLELESLTERIIGCAIMEHRALGPGLLESCYEAALAIEFGDQNLAFLRQPAVSVGYKGRTVGQFRPDSIVEGLVVVELFLNFHSPTVKAGLKRYIL